MSNNVEVMKMDSEANVKGIVIVALAVKGHCCVDSESKAVKTLPLFSFTKLEEVYSHRHRAPPAPTNHLSKKTPRFRWGKLRMRRMSIRLHIAARGDS
jgi:hypothetical protein